MTGLTETRPMTDVASRRPSQLRIYRTEATHEFLKLIRVPIFAISTIAFPLMFYVIFGLTFADETAGGVGVTTYMLATYGAFGVIGCALFGFGVGVAIERGQGWMRLKRVSPMPPLAYFVAKIAMSTSFATVIVVALFVLGATFGGVRMPAEQWLGLAARPRHRRPAVLRHGPRLRLPGRAELGPGGAEPRLPADGVRLRPLDPALAAAGGGAGDRTASCRRIILPSSRSASSARPMAAARCSTWGRSPPSPSASW